MVQSQAPCRGIDAVVEFLGGRQDGFARGVAVPFAAPTEDHADGRGRQTGVLGDVFSGDAHRDIRLGEGPGKTGFGVGASGCGYESTTDYADTYLFVKRLFFSSWFRGLDPTTMGYTYPLPRVVLMVISPCPGGLKRPATFTTPHPKAPLWAVEWPCPGPPTSRNGSFWAAQRFGGFALDLGVVKMSRTGADTCLPIHVCFPLRPSQPSHGIRPCT